MIAVPPAIEEILGRLRAAGWEACPVGGCVRDSLLGRTPGDWDVATAAPPEAVIACFGGENTLPTGLKHGTVTVLCGGLCAEVTTYRTESGYSDRRRPDSVRFVRSLEEDLRRRDFTVNAMALAADGGIVDPFGGRDDLQKRLLRCVGEPEERFAEDPLRILRALRFAARLDFAIEESTAEAMRRCRFLLPALSAERMQKELAGLLAAPAPGRLLADYVSVLRAALPELSEDALSAASAEAIDRAPADAAMRAALLLRALEEPAARALLLRLRCSRAVLNRVSALRRALCAPPPAVREELLPAVRSLGWADAAAVCAFTGGGAAALLKEARAENLPVSPRELALSGDDPALCGVSKGPAVGEALEALLRAVWRGEAANTPDDLRRFLSLGAQSPVTKAPGRISAREPG